MVLASVKSKIKVPADLILDEGPHPGLQVAAISLYAHVTSSWGACGESGSSGVSSSYKGTNPIVGAPTSSSKPIICHRLYLLPPSCWELRLQPMDFGGVITIQSITTACLFFFFFFQPTHKIYMQSTLKNLKIHMWNSPCLLRAYLLSLGGQHR